MSYVDGYVLPVPKKKLATYKSMARKASVVWKDHGAVEYFECAGDDLEVKPGCGTAFPRMLKSKAGETVIFAFVVYKSRAHRDRVNAKVMKDPRLAAMMAGKAMPFDVKRMLYGGFKTLVQA